MSIDNTTNKKYKRNYQKEREKEKETITTRLVKIDKNVFEQLQIKLSKENKSFNGFVKEQIKKYLEGEAKMEDLEIIEDYDEVGEFFEIGKYHLGQIINRACETILGNDEEDSRKHELINKYYENCDTLLKIEALELAELLNIK